MAELNRAVIKMKKGEVALVTIEPEYAFGSNETLHGLVVVPHSVVYCEVRLVTFNKKTLRLHHLFHKWSLRRKRVQKQAKKKKLLKSWRFKFRIISQVQLQLMGFVANIWNEMGSSTSGQAKDVSEIYGVLTRAEKQNMKLKKKKLPRPWRFKYKLRVTIQVKTKKLTATTVQRRWPQLLRILKQWIVTVHVQQHLKEDENSLFKTIDFGLSDFYKVGNAYYIAPVALKRKYETEADV
ncbi:hypothetical protein Bca4012_026305 [Brassica carinata]